MKAYHVMKYEQLELCILTSLIGERQRLAGELVHEVSRKLFYVTGNIAAESLLFQHYEYFYYNHWNQRI